MENEYHKLREELMEEFDEDISKTKLMKRYVKLLDNTDKYSKIFIDKCPEDYRE